MARKQIPVAIRVLILIILLGGAIALFFLYVFDEKPKEANGWEIYRNEEYSFEIGHPINSKVIEEEAYLISDFELLIEGDVVVTVSVGYDKVGYDLRIDSLLNRNNITEIEVEEDIIEGKKSFKAEYITKSVFYDTTKEVPEVKLYVIEDEYAHIVRCSEHHDKCNEVISTFKLLN